MYIYIYIYVCVAVLVEGVHARGELGQGGGVLLLGELVDHVAHLM